MYLLHCFISACLLSSPLHHKYGIHVIVCVMLSVCCHVISILCCLLCYVHWEQSNSWSPGPCMCTHSWSIKPNLILNKPSVFVLQSSELLKNVPLTPLFHSGFPQSIVSTYLKVNIQGCPLPDSTALSLSPVQFYP